MSKMSLRPRRTLNFFSPAQPPTHSGLGALCIVLLISCACATTPAPTTTRSAQRTSLPELERRALLILMADQRRFDPLAVTAAANGSPALRRLSALTLGRVGDSRGVPILDSLLADSNAGVRRAAAFSLGLLAERGIEAARGSLEGAAGDADRGVGIVAVEAMARGGASLEEALNALSTAPVAELLPRLVPSLFRFSGPSVISWAEQGLELAAATGDHQLRAMAAYGLAREPQQEGAPILRRLLSDSDPWVRGWAARALGRVGERADLERLLPLLEDSAPGPIIQALRAGRQIITAGTAPPPEDWQPKILELMADPRPGVRLTAIESSSAWLLDAALEARLEAFARDGLGREQELALLALGEASSPRVTVLLPELATARVSQVRAAAARVAALVGEGELLARLAIDEAGLVRRVALESLLDLADIGSQQGTDQGRADQGLSEEAAQLVASALEDGDVGVRSTLLDWAAENPVVGGAILVEALDRARRDREADARLSAVDALTARAEAVRAERDAAIAVLTKLAEDKDFLLRRQAALGLERLGEQTPPLGPIETGRSGFTYRQIAEQTAEPITFLMTTAAGNTHFELACQDAPLHCLSFTQLAGQGYFDGLTFHRIVPDFVAQGGDPRGDGLGGPGYSLRDEPTLLRYGAGIVGMARAARDTGGSQFFITLSAQPHLDGAYTAFGRVTAGFETLEKLVQGESIIRLRRAPPGSSK